MGGSKAQCPVEVACRGEPPTFQGVDFKRSPDISASVWLINKGFIIARCLRQLLVTAPDLSVEKDIIFITVLIFEGAVCSLCSRAYRLCRH